jgi:hypothetical protein
MLIVASWWQSAHARLAAPVFSFHSADGVVILHRLAVAAEIGITGATLVERDIRAKGRASDCKCDHRRHYRTANDCAQQ